VPEDDDKPLKYPLMFQVSDVMLINKIDVMPVFDFDVEKAKKRVKELNPDMEVFEISAKTGAGFDAWVNDLQRRVMAE
jgi:hydrogenase nickel incorporation protein HypB